MPSQLSVRPTEPILHTAYVTEANEACPPEINGVVVAAARVLRHRCAAGHRGHGVRTRQRGQTAPGSAVEGCSAGAATTAAAALPRLA